MTVRNTLLAAAMLAMIPLSGHAAEDSLGTPVVELMPHLKQLRPSLELNDKQNRIIDSWIAQAGQGAGAELLLQAEFADRIEQRGLALTGVVGEFLDG